MKIGRWALQETRNNYRFVVFFVLNMSIGLVGFLCLDALKTSIAASSLESSKAILSADVGVSVRRQWTESEIQTAAQVAELEAKEIHQNILMGRTQEFFSMIASPRGSRLVQIKVIDDLYPFYGKLVLDQRPFYGKLVLDQRREIRSGESRDIQLGANIWVYPELLSQLKVQVGDSVKLGNQEYKITGVIDEDGSQTMRLASLAPRIFMGLNQVQKSQLISFGTTITDSLLFKTSAGSADLLARLNKTLRDPAIRIESFESAAEETGRPLRYLTDYLGLVSLVALFLAALGSAYLFRTYIFSRYYQIAIFNSLGLPKRQAQKIYLLQITCLAFVASLVSLVGARLLLPQLSEVLQSLTTMSLNLTLPAKTIGLSLVMAVFGSWLIGWPFLRPTERIVTSALLQEKSRFQESSRFYASDFLLFIPGLILYWLLAVWQAQSWLTGSLFVGLFFASLVVLWLLGWILLGSLSRIRAPFRWMGRQAFLNLGRRRGASLAALISLGLGALLMNLLPQLEASLQQDLSAPRNLKLPSLFMFDIQTEQVDPLQQFVASQGFQLQQLSPLVRSRILSINGKAYERQKEAEFGTREEEQQVRFRNRGVNLTYREGLTESETLEEGRPFSGKFDPLSGKPAEVSVEKKYAGRVGISLNDQILFDVQGIEVLGQVVNLRSVRWNSFQPNFFIQMQPGVLEEAPKTFLASISGTRPEQVTGLQDALVEKFPNISLIDVGRLIKKVFEISNKMSWSLKLMATLSLVAGFVVLFSIANFEVRRRTWEVNLYKILGGRRQELIGVLALEFGLLGFMAASFGIFLSYAVSWSLASILFDGSYAIDWITPMWTLGLVTGLSLVIVIVVAWSIVRQKPADLLQG